MTIGRQQHTPKITDSCVRIRHVKRDGFVDNCRGIFHIMLTLDHLIFVFPAFTILGDFYQPLGYVSLAEGFVFLSGFVSGLVYTRVNRERGSRATWSKAAVRALAIYVCYVAAVVIQVMLVKYGGTSGMQWYSWTDLLRLSLPVITTKVVLLLYQPSFLGILPMYCLFLLITPAILGQLERGNYIVVGVVSSLLWVAAQPEMHDLLVRLVSSRADVFYGYFNLFAWQILFVAGVICGHKTFADNNPWLPQNLKVFGLAYVVAVSFFIMRHKFVELPIDDRWVNWSFLGPLRLLDFACVTFLICRLRGQIERYIAWQGFAFLSKHSLQVFAFHLIPIYLVGLVLGEKTLPIWAQLLVMGFCIASLFLIAFLAALFKKHRTRFRSKQQVGSIVPFN